jgi:hypothetical protein
MATAMLAWLSRRVEEFEEAWRVNTLGAFAAARAVIP